MRPGRDVAETQHRQRRGAIGIADHMSHSRVGLRDVVEAGKRAERTGLTEGGYRAHDDLWVAPIHLFPAEPHAADHAGREVLDEHVDLRQERTENLETRRLFRVDADALFAPILLDVVSAAAVAERPEAAREVALRRQLDLDHFRSHLGEEPGARRAGEHLGEVEHLETVEHVTHQASSLRPSNVETCNQ